MVPLHRPHRVPRHLPQAGARAHRAVGEAPASPTSRRTRDYRQPARRRGRTRVVGRARPGRRQRDRRPRPRPSAPPARRRRTVDYARRSLPAPDPHRRARSCSWSVASLLATQPHGHALLRAVHGPRRPRPPASAPSGPGGTGCSGSPRRRPGAVLDRRRRDRRRRLRRCSSPWSSAPPSSSARCSPTATCDVRASTAPSSSPSCSCRRRAAWSWPWPTTSSCCSSASRPCPSPSTSWPAMHLRRVQSQEAGHQVLRARRLLVGVPPVRHRPHLRRHRLHQPRRRSRNFLGHHTPLQRTTVLLLGGLALLLVGLRLQGGGGAVPLLDARRLRRRPHARRWRSWPRP